VIDHHTDYGRKSKKTLFLKVQKFSNIEPSKYPTSKAVYDLFSRHVDLATHSWLACTGLIGDNQLNQWKDFVETEAKRHDSDISELSKIVALISGVEVLAPNKLHELLLFLTKCKKPSDVLKSKFAKYSIILDKKIAKLLLDFEKKKIIFPEKELVWYEFKAKGNFKSELINRISNQIYPNMTLIVVQDKGDNWLLFSARRQDFKVKMNSLLEKAVSGLKGAGAGGHVPAAAGRVNKKDYEEFKKRILEQLSKK
jgi:nanoRNase/pAp phosphatase (c-di-AMP/oligoRNAs hydrolase)